MLQGVSSGLERMPENMCVNSSSSRRSVATVRDGLAPKTAPGVGKIALLLEQRDDRTRAPTAENGSPQRNWKSRSTSSPARMAQNVSLSDIAFSMDFEDEVLEFSGWTLCHDAPGSQAR